MKNLLNLKNAFDELRETASRAREKTRQARARRPLDLDDLLMRRSRMLFSQAGADLPEA
ncbi:MAG: hypothetical protein P8182_17605 [Deltaproteobacteria bacterium]